MNFEFFPQEIREIHEIPGESGSTGDPAEVAMRIAPRTNRCRWILV